MGRTLLVPLLLLVISAANGSPLERGREIVLTKETIAAINAQNAGFQARYYNQFDGVGLDGLKRLAGASSRPSKLHRNPAPEKHDDISLLDTEPFDVADNWPHCASIFREIGVQGNCDASWAFSVTTSIRDRRCILTNNSDPISAYDLLSCCLDCQDDQGNGCNGGDHDDAFQYFINSGIVTGGAYRSRQGCVPYPIRPDPDETRVKATKCNQRCQQSYSPNYDGDKVYGDGYKTFTYQNQDVMEEVKANGPVVAEFVVYQDFLAYSGGVYRHVAGTKVGYGYAKIIGWGISDNGDSYWRAVYSINKGWGENGTFRVLIGDNGIGFESGIIAGSIKLSASANSQ